MCGYTAVPEDTGVLVFIGCLLSDPILLPKRRIICRSIFEQINTYYTANYFTACIQS